jgi:uncharacterized protein (TIGR00730 family)
MKRICVYCGSNPGLRKEYADAAVAVGEALAKRGLGLIYGGGAVGLMGIVADAALARGAQVIGVIPEKLMLKEIAHMGVSEMFVTKTMHERKALMTDLADGFIALPGGIGTFDELFESWTWGQLGYHRKPFGLLNVADYYTPLVSFLDHVTEQGFMRAEHRAALMVETFVEPLLDRFATFTPPELPKWLAREDR